MGFGQKLVVNFGNSPEDVDTVLWVSHACSQMSDHLLLFSAGVSQELLLGTNKC